MMFLIDLCITQRRELRMTLEPLILKMISYDHGSPERIQHFLKVHSFAKTIAVSEHLDE